jgi:hypothetical protein
MRSRSRLIHFGLLSTLAAIGAGSGAAVAADDTQALKAEIEALRKEVQELRALVKKAPPTEEVAALRQEVAKARSEWKDVASTKHFAGYADAGYTDAKNGSGLFDLARFNPAFHYQYQDLVLLDAELEIAVDEDGGTETGLEFATISLLAHDYAAVYAGKFNSGIGQFRQNLHPGWINRLPSTPVGFGHDQAAPTSEVGAGVRGGLPLGPMRATYDLWVGNGPRLELNAAGDEIEMIEAEGATSDPDEKKVFGGRIALLPLPKLELGLSAARGKVAVVTDGTAEAARDYDVLGADAAYQWKNLDLRGEYVQQKVGGLAGSVAPAGGKWKAWYLQAAYRLAPTKWEGVVRYGDYNTPHADQDQKQWALGVNYWFAPNLVGKIAYEWNKGLTGTPNDDNRWLLQAAYGF